MRISAVLLLSTAILLSHFNTPTQAQVSTQGIYKPNRAGFERASKVHHPWQHLDSFDSQVAQQQQQQNDEQVAFQNFAAGEQQQQQERLTHQKSFGQRYQSRFRKQQAHHHQLNHNHHNDDDDQDDYEDQRKTQQASVPVLELPPMDNEQLKQQERDEQQSFKPIRGVVPEYSGAYQFGKAVHIQELKFEQLGYQPDAAVQDLMSLGRWKLARTQTAENRRRSSNGGDDHTEKEEEEVETATLLARENQDDGAMVWQLEIYSPGALSLNLIFSHFELPPGAEFYVSGESTFLGAFTAEVNNKADKTFATAPIKGDRLLLEYYEPAWVSSASALDPEGDGVRRRARMQLGQVIHGYKPMRTAGSRHEQQSEDEVVEEEEGVINTMSGKCNVDVACHTEEYENQIKSVGMILTDYNQKYCTGSLVNNAAQDGRQLFLTANHCTGFADTSAHLVMFNHQKLQCGSSGEEVNEQDTASGLVKLGGYAPSDYTLYEILETIPDAYNLYLSGWSASPKAPKSRKRRTTAPEDDEDEEEDDGGNPADDEDRANKIPIVGIHHPSGDSKKISFFYNGSLPKTCWNECSQDPTEHYHWQIPKWSIGTTEPGSSGSPLFDADKRIVGQLHGGSASCWNVKGYDVYGGIFASYNVPPKIKDRLSTYLDPENTGKKYLDGYSLELARKETRKRQAESEENLWRGTKMGEEEEEDEEEVPRVVSNRGHHDQLEKPLWVEGFRRLFEM